MFEYPNAKNFRYGNKHLKFLKLMTVQAEFPYSETTKSINDTNFYFKWQRHEGIIDFCDLDDLYLDSDLPIFKAHYSKYIDYPNNIFPLGPMCGGRVPTSNNIHYLFSHEYQYNPQRGFSNKQIPWGHAIRRRNYVKSLFTKTNYSVDQKIEDSPLKFWRANQNVLGAICVPGRVNNMLDRGQLELMLLGVCTISPELPELLLGKELLPGVHYIKCKDDYSDLLDIMEELTPDKAKEIGNCAKTLKINYHPIYFMQWITNNVVKR